MDRINLIINLVIGILVIIGFFGYFARVAGLYKEGGLLNNLWKIIKEKFKKNNEIFLEIKRKAYKALGKLHCVIRLFDGCMYISVVAMGGIFLMNGKINAGDYACNSKDDADNFKSLFHFYDLRVYNYGIIIHYDGLNVNR